MLRSACERVRPVVVLLMRSNAGTEGSPIASRAEKECLRGVFLWACGQSFELWHGRGAGRPEYSEGFDSYVAAHEHPGGTLVAWVVGLERSGQVVCGPTNYAVSEGRDVAVGYPAQQLRYGVCAHVLDCFLWCRGRRWWGIGEEARWVSPLRPLGECVTCVGRFGWDEDPDGCDYDHRKRCCDKGPFSPGRHAPMMEVCRG